MGVVRLEGLGQLLREGRSRIGGHQSRLHGGRLRGVLFAGAVEELVDRVGEIVAEGDVVLGEL